MTTTMQVTQLNSGVFTIENYLSPDQCHRYIAQGDGIGYVPSEVNLAAGSRRMEEIRNNDRVIFDDPALAALLFERARPHLPIYINDWKLHGFNERMRFYRYGPNQYFKWHKDGSFAKSPTEASCLTFMIYLNDGFEGGDTEFRTEFVKPKAGMALVFPHRMPHQGNDIVSGTKYVLRTDVMYQQGE
jgi:prolyl 4-hydroxylase